MPTKSRDSERSDRRGSGKPFPVPLRGCREATGGWMKSARSAKRPKGFGETFPRAPQGLSRSDWGLDEKCAKREATEGVW